MSQPNNTPSRCELTYAFLLLRLFLAVRALMSTLEKFESGGT